MVVFVYVRVAQPFAIAGRITFIYMKYGRQWVRVIFMRYCQVPTNTEHIQTLMRNHSITICYITIQIVTHRVDWFSCVAFVLLQYTPERPPNLIF